jgi:hypothetical protein
MKHLGENEIAAAREKATAMKAAVAAVAAGSGVCVLCLSVWVVDTLLERLYSCSEN